jgi:hypothetical protein
MKVELERLESADLKQATLFYFWLNLHYFTHIKPVINKIAIIDKILKIAIA